EEKEKGKGKGKGKATMVHAATKPQLKAVPQAKPEPPAKPNWAGRVPDIKPGTYSDGLPLHQVQYLCCKMMLRPNHFTSRESLLSFGKVMHGPAKECGVGFTSKGFHANPL